MRWMALLAGLAVPCAFAETISGTVTKVIDGDTLVVRDAAKKRHTVRLAEIDAPEPKQPFYAESGRSLAELCHRKAATVEWSARDERRESLAMRQDTIEPPSLSYDRGAMLTAVVDGGYGYCATSDLSAAGLQAALDRATRWAEATRGKSVVRYEPSQMDAPRGEY